MSLKIQKSAQVQVPKPFLTQTETPSPPEEQTWKCMFTKAMDTWHLHYNTINLGYKTLSDEEISQLSTQPKPLSHTEHITLETRE